MQSIVPQAALDRLRQARGFAGSRLAAGATAALLGALWLDTRRRVSGAERMHPPAGRFVHIGPERVHVVTGGRGHPVVLLHGAGMTLDEQAISLYAAVAGRYRAVLFDRPGHGYSTRSGRLGSPLRQARLLRRALRALGLRRPMLVGHSFGAVVALAWAMQFPEEVAGVVAIAGLAYPEPRPDLMPFTIPAVPMVGPVLRNTLLQPIDRLMLPALVRRMFAPEPVPLAFQRVISPDFALRPAKLRADAEDLAALVPALGRLQSGYRELDLPVALLAGTGDRIADPLRHAARLAEALPDPLLALLPGAGHMLHHHRPEQVLDALEWVAARAGLDDAPLAEESGEQPAAA